MGISRLSAEIFLSQSAETSSWGNPFLQCFINFPVAKNIMDKRGGGYQDFPCKKFSLTAEKIRRATLLCSVSEIFR